MSNNYVEVTGEFFELLYQWTSCLHFLFIQKRLLLHVGISHIRNIVHIRWFLRFSWSMLDWWLYLCILSTCRSFLLPLHFWFVDIFYLNVNMNTTYKLHSLNLKNPKANPSPAFLTLPINLFAQRSILPIASIHLRRYPSPNLQICFTKNKTRKRSLIDHHRTSPATVSDSIKITISHAATYRRHFETQPTRPDISQAPHPSQHCPQLPSCQ